MIRRNVSAIAALSLFAITAVATARAQDCGTLFSSGFFNESSMVSADDTILRIQEAVCRDDVTTLEQAKSSVQQFGASLGPFSAKYDNASADSNFSEWKYHFCSESARDSSTHSTFRQKIRTASPELTAAFIACLNRPGVHLTLVGAASSKGFTVKAIYMPPIRAPRYAGPHSGLQNLFTFQNATCRPRGVRQIGEEGLMLTCLRKKTDEASTVAINTDSGSDVRDISSFRIDMGKNSKCQPQNKTVNTFVPATAGWVDTGIAVPAGTTLHLVADPTTTWTIGSGPMFPFKDSCGWPQAPAVTPAQLQQFPMPKAPFGSLIAQIGKEAIYEVCGAADLQAIAAGNLFLSINDASLANTPGFSDNLGTMGVTVTYVLPCPH
jgi:hypothetical protein